MSGRRRVIGAALAGTVLTGLVALAVHPVARVSGLGYLPLAAALWAVFAVGAWLVRRSPLRWSVALIIMGGILLQAVAASAPPRGSDDLYRYIWDGRVQAAGVSPYRYVPASPELARLRGPFLWPADGTYCVAPGARADQAGPGRGELLDPGCTVINRPAVPTIYPPAAEAYFLAVHAVSPPRSGSTPIQAAAALCALVTTGVLLWGLRALRRDPRLAVLWAWCPVVVLEAGNNAHVDVLAAGLAAAAMVMLASPGRLGRSVSGGTLLGLAIAAKLAPILVVPAVLKRRWRAVVSAAAAATVIAYLPHLVAVGGKVIGFLPGYLRQEGYDNGSRFALISLAVNGRWAIAAAFAVLAVVALMVLRRSDPDRPWRGALVMTGAALAVATPPFPWYSMLLVMLAAFDGRAEWLALAAVNYLSTRHPLPFVAMSGTQSEQVGYGLALAVVAASALARWSRARGMAGGPPAPVTGPLPSDPGATPPAREPSSPAAAPPTGASGVRR